MKLISREARKVSLRLVVLTQSPEVKAIGLEGEGSVRDNFCFIRLGEFALDHAKSLKDEQIKSAIENADRPAMLGNLPCAIPQLSDRVAMPVLSMPSDYALLTNNIADTLQPSFEAIDTPSTLVSPSAQSKLSAPLEAILDYARKQNSTKGDAINSKGIVMATDRKAIAMTTLLKAENRFLSLAALRFTR
jgi:hypothetical protein